MKKILALLIVSLLFGFNASAMNKKQAKSMEKIKNGAIVSISSIKAVQLTGFDELAGDKGWGVTVLVIDKMFKDPEKFPRQEYIENIRTRALAELPTVLPFKLIPEEQVLNEKLLKISPPNDPKAGKNIIAAQGYPILTSFESKKLAEALKAVKDADAIVTIDIFFILHANKPGGPPAGWGYINMQSRIVISVKEPVKDKMKDIIRIEGVGIVQEETRYTYPFDIKKDELFPMAGRAATAAWDNAIVKLKKELAE